MHSPILIPCELKFKIGIIKDVNICFEVQLHMFHLIISWAPKILS
jgi:hypothetical protein